MCISLTPKPPRTWWRIPVWFKYITLTQTLTLTLLCVRIINVSTSAWRMELTVGQKKNISLWEHKLYFHVKFSRKNSIVLNPTWPPCHVVANQEFSYHLFSKIYFLKKTGNNACSHTQPSYISPLTFFSDFCFQLAFQTYLNIYARMQQIAKSLLHTAARRHRMQLSFPAI